MPLYSIDVQLWATAYIKADSAEEAEQIARGLKGSALELEEQDGEVPISGAMYDDPELPDVSLSPAMSIVGPEGQSAELVKGDDE
jgi:hypothetical protein